MRIYYDCEFVEDGERIDLVSIGMVTERDESYYAVCSEFNKPGLLSVPWLRDNVWPSLPQKLEYRDGDAFIRTVLDEDHADVKPRSQIRDEVARFILKQPQPELWAWYGAYDHVVLAQLFGKMIDLPKGVPMWTNDLKQELTRVERLVGAKLTKPKQLDGHHNALADAKHNKAIHQWLAATEEEHGK